MECHWVLSGRKPSTINPACMRGTFLLDSLQWGAEPVSPAQGFSSPHLPVGCTPGWGSLLGLRQFTAESRSWHFGRSWKLSLTSAAECSLERIPAWCHTRWVDEIQHCWELDGVLHVEYLHQIFHSEYLFLIFHTCPVPHRAWIQTAVILLHGPLKLQHV